MYIYIFIYPLDLYIIQTYSHYMSLQLINYRLFQQQKSRSICID